MARNLQTSKLVIPDRSDSDGDYVEVSTSDPFPVRSVLANSFMGNAISADMLWNFAKNGQIFIASDADVDDMVTGTVSGSFDTTTTTFMLSVPAGTTAIPLFVNMQQGGTVGGGTVFLFTTLNTVDRYSTGGTSEKVFNLAGNAAKCVLRSSATATTDAIGYGIRVWGTQIGQDIAPAEGAVQAGIWKPEVPYLLKGPASMNIYSHAATTGPTWVWSIGWAEVNTKDIFGN